MKTQSCKPGTFRGDCDSAFLFLLCKQNGRDGAQTLLLKAGVKPLSSKLKCYFGTVLPWRFKYTRNPGNVRGFLYIDSILKRLIFDTPYRVAGSFIELHDSEAGMRMSKHIRCSIIVGRCC